MNNFIETIKLIRPINCLLAMAGVLVGASFVWYRPIYYNPFMASLATFLVCAAGNVVNDLVDIETDRINHPDRVLVRGSLRKKYALVLASILNLTAILVAYTVNLSVMLIALSAIGLLFMYNLWAKKVLLLGNLIIALLTGLTFIAGGAAVDISRVWLFPGPLIPAIFAFLFHFVREIIKDIQDIEGDQRAGIKSLPMVIGIHKAIMTAIILFLIMAVFTYIPIIMYWFGFWYKVITVYIIDLPLLAFLIFLWGNPTPKMLELASILLKIGMGLGILALILT